MWNNSIVQRANRIAVALLILMAMVDIAMAVGWIPLSFFWGVETLQSSATGIASALLLILMATLVDRRASSGQPSRWLRLSVWLITAVVVTWASSYWMSENAVERWVLGTLSVLAALSCAIVASSTPTIMTTPVYDEIPESSIP